MWVCRLYMNVYIYTLLLHDKHLWVVEKTHFIYIPTYMHQSVLKWGPATMLL